MDSSEKPHRATSNSELFICFTSRLSSSSSSMKLSSKSILSPGRAREPSQISLSSSLSRRLRSNGSMKGGQASPMFPTGGKKRGNFENPEPSSPKVTCIGQVRVKTKKQGKKMRSRSRKRGEVSFRKVEQSNSNVEAPNLGNLGNFHSDLSHRQQPEGLPHRNQRWVHLPLTICEALRAFGADFNCFLPCRSSCSSRDQREDHKAEGAGNGGSSSSCAAVFARWLVAAQEGAAAAEESVLERRSSQRRDVFEGIEFEEEKCERKNEVVEEEEEARVSTCVPPKNALLLMRCRSDPLRMAALANRFWESPAPQDEDGEDNKDGEDEENGNEEEDDVEEGEVARKSEVGTERHKEEEICERWVAAEEALENHEIPDVEENEEESEEDDDSEIRELKGGNPENQEEKKELEVNQSLSEEKETVFPSENEENLGQLLEENEDLLMLLHEHNEGGENEDESDAEHHEEEEERSTSIHTFPVPEEEEPEAKAEAEESSMEEKETSEEEDEGEDEPEPENPDIKERPGLPDCLLLMMCEPKLSMEVSKETWVCSTDFIRWHPEKHVEKVKKTDGGDAPKKRISIDSNPAAALPPPPPPQPARSSCSFPSATAAASSMATMIEQKLVNAVAYEPFVLTRCKSEPMRTAAKLAPEACFWKSRKLEPHKPAVGAAGVGF